MSVASNNILKLLSDLSSSSDRIAEEFNLPPLSQWTSVVKQKADSIAESDENPTESGGIPTLMSYIGTSSRGPRASAVLTEIQRRHLHRNAKVSVKNIRGSRKSSLRTPLPRRSSVKKVSVQTENNTPELKIPPSMVIKETGNSSTLTMKRTERETPKGKETALKTKDGSSKRKSSSELSVLEIKKAKTIERDLLEREQMKSSSNYSNAKSSVGATNISQLKENRFMLRSKMETKQDTASKNRKHIMALRQQKLEQNKKMREIKMEKHTHPPLKEGEKQESKLRSRVEKNMTTPKMAAAGATLTADKSSMKKDKPISVKKMDHHKKIGASGILKSSAKIAKKENHETGKVLNATFAVGGEKPSQPHSSFKGKKRDDISSKTQTLKKQQTPSQKKGPESYAITPARSSFVSYDISEIRSDSEEEEQETNTKPIPSWATGVRLRNALLQQHHHPIDTDELFGNVVELPDLSLIMGISKKHYKKRTSSAVWNSSFS